MTFVTISLYKTSDFIFPKVYNYCILSEILDFANFIADKNFILNLSNNIKNILRESINKRL